MKLKLFVSILMAMLALGTVACGTDNSENAGHVNGENDNQPAVGSQENSDQKKQQSASGADNEDIQSRQTYTLAEIDSGLIDNKITFNSITDAEEVGNEIDFTSVQEAGADGRAINPHGTWEGGTINVENGKEYIVRLYVHNNNPTGLTATGTKVAISGIGQSKTNKNDKQEVEVNGFISSDNATPKEYWDYVRFNSNTSFHLEYVMGSAMIYNRGAVGTTDPVTSAEIKSKQGAERQALLDAHTVTGRPLSDDIVLKAADADGGGTLIGFDALDGNVPGCYPYSSYITIRVKAVFDQ